MARENIKEVFNVLSNMPSDVFGYMNSDILVKKDFFSVFKKDIDAYIFYKKDIECLTAEDFLNNNIKITDEFPAGVDAFFFKRSWWIANKYFFLLFFSIFCCYFIITIIFFEIIIFFKKCF